MFNSARPLSTDSAASVQWIESAVKNPMSKPRLLLWVDAVGGFFVCQGSTIQLGQAVPDSTVDVPLLADLSRHHATIRRDEEGYTIEPVRDVWLNHHKIDAPTWLNDGCLIQLGPALVMRFSRPHPLSATARLDFVSNHRTQPSAAAVLLMADTCVLGPGTTWCATRGSTTSCCTDSTGDCTAAVPNRSRWTGNRTSKRARSRRDRAWSASNFRSVWRKSECSGRRPGVIILNRGPGCLGTNIGESTARTRKKDFSEFWARRTNKPCSVAKGI
jgi:hypothetical protein